MPGLSSLTDLFIPLEDIPSEMQVKQKVQMMLKGYFGNSYYC